MNSPGFPSLDDIYCTSFQRRDVVLVAANVGFGGIDFAFEPLDGSIDPLRVSADRLDQTAKFSDFFGLLFIQLLRLVDDLGDQRGHIRRGLGWRHRR